MLERNDEMDPQNMGELLNYTDTDPDSRELLFKIENIHLVPGKTF